MSWIANGGEARRTSLLAAAPMLAFLSGAATACGQEPTVARAGERVPARWIDDSGLYSSGFGTVSFEARDGHHLDARVYRSTTFDAATGPIWFVMHGASRDVDRYIRTAAPVAERYDALAIAIHFSKQAYPKGSDYTLGLQESGLLRTDSLGRPRWRSRENMLYAELEHVFDAVVGSLRGRQSGYYLFGHSAGAQFVHRLLTFLPEPRVLGAVAANAGWYTLPTAKDSRIHSMPYGLLGGPVEPGGLRRFFRTPFAVLLGENDTTTAATDPMVRGTPEAESQGATRLERGRHYFATAEEQSAALGAEFAWRLAIVPRAGHDAARVIDSAGYLTFVPDAKSCIATRAADAAGLAITEILADPPAGMAGDANGDGERDPAADEFVEIVNRGPEPVCLTGWTLGDAAHADRHVFPIGPALAPGTSLVVFGGGVPTGRFDGALVQWSKAGLSLTNKGDVLTLRDADDVIVRQVSWGDCAGEPRADDHWPGALEIDASLARGPGAGADWAVHPEVDGRRRYSPGLIPGAPSAKHR